MSRCGSCNADIEWVMTEKGKRMPMDAEPVEGGNLVLTGATIRGAREVRYLTKKAQPSPLLGESEETYVSHFATCPEAERYRR